MSAEGVSHDLEKTPAIAVLPKPAEKRSVRRFLGLGAYCRPFVQTPLQIDEPIIRLKKNTEPFFWSPDQEKDFVELKSRLEGIRIIGHFDDEADTELHRYASNVLRGALLVQWQAGIQGDLKIL